jgi:glycosyltransferase involved in cell wall biosynthesis
MDTSKIAIIIVTYKRQNLLKILLNSIIEMNPKIGRVYIVDNENSPETKKIVETSEKKMPPLKSQTKLKLLDFVYLPQMHNSGGAGGFCAGTKAAYRDGYEWFWLIDDDVKVLSYALSALLPLMQKYNMIQGQRFDYDRTNFYWQYNFNHKLGIPNPLASANLAEDEIRPMNTACFEGTIFNKWLIDKIGWPDARFFIYWDDTIFGYLATKFTQPIYSQRFILQRTRQVKNLNLGIRHLRGTSDIVRYHMMKNRGFMANYYKLYGDYNPIAFSIGTLLTLAKEFIRIITVDKTYKSSIIALLNGLKAAKKIKNDPNWKPSIWYKNNLKEFADQGQMI